MSYIDENLLADERILYRTKKHFIIFLIPTLWTLITFFFSFNSSPTLQNVAFAPAIIALLAWGYAIINYIVADFAVTNKRVIMREGFFFRHVNDTRLTTVANITTNQSLLAQLLNYGNVYINTFGGERDMFSQIAFPNKFQKQVQILLLERGAKNL